MESRITRFKKRIRCDIDGGKCTDCHKCDHLPKKKSNLLNKLLISTIIILLIIFVLHPILEYEVVKGSQINEKSTQDSTSLLQGISNYDSSMQNNERSHITEDNDYNPYPSNNYESSSY